MINIHTNNTVHSTVTAASGKSETYTSDSVYAEEAVERFNKAMRENDNKIDVGRGRETPNNPNCRFDLQSIVSSTVAGSAGGLKGIVSGMIGGIMGSLQCDGKGPLGLFGGPGSGSESSDDSTVK